MIFQATPVHLARAAALLRQGELIAFPTETVFGLGGNALDDAAVTRIYAAKGRDFTNPLAIMVASIEQAEMIALVDDRARSLMQHFWPGPISIVLPYRQDAAHPVSAQALAGLSTVSLRMPSHPVALALLREAGLPLAVPSANRSGSLSPTRALDVVRDFDTQTVPMVLADATKILGIESTIIDLTEAQAKILRLGAVTQEAIEAVIGAVTCVSSPIRASGKAIQLKTPLRLDAVDVKQGEAFLGFGALNFIGVEGIGFVRDMPDTHWRNLSAEGDLHQAAANLYRMLAELDAVGATRIAVMRVPETGLGVTINDRLRRCALQADLPHEHAVPETDEKP